MIFGYTLSIYYFNDLNHKELQHQRKGRYMFFISCSLSCSFALVKFHFLVYFLVHSHFNLQSCAKKYRKIGLYVVIWPWRSRRVTPMMMPPPCPSGSRLLQTFSKFSIIVSKLWIQNSRSFHTFIESVYFYRA